MSKDYKSKSKQETASAVETGTPKERAKSRNWRDEFIGFGIRNFSSNDNKTKLTPEMGVGHDARPVFRTTLDTHTLDPNWSEYPAIYKIMDRGFVNTPGLFVLRYTPTPLVSNGNFQTETEQRWRTIHEELSAYDNTTYEMQPSDLQIFAVAEMLTRSYMAEYRTALSIYNVHMSKTLNKFWNKDQLWTAFFAEDASPDEPLSYESEWDRYKIVQRYNDNLLPWFDKFVSFAGMFPGLNRWSALSGRLFKDAKVEDEQCQYYMFKQQYWYKLNEDWVDPEDHSKGRTYQLKAELAPTTFKAMFEFIYHNLAVIVSSEGGDRIQKIMRKYWTRAGEDKAVDLGMAHPKFNYLALNHNSLSVAYDPDMLTAISNATVCRGITIGDIVQKPNRGFAYQDVYFMGGEHNWGGRMAVNMGKPLNLPMENASPCDIINATQWHIQCDRDTMPARTAVFSLYGYEVGTEIITSCDIYYMTSDGKSHKYIWDPIQFVEGISKPNSYQVFSNAVFNFVLATKLATHFFGHPMIYPIIHNATGGSAVTEDQWRESVYTLGPLTDTECLYKADGYAMSQIHTEWQRGFWGQPDSISETGTWATDFEPTEYPVETSIQAPEVNTTIG